MCSRSKTPWQCTTALARGAEAVEDRREVFEGLPLGVRRHAGILAGVVPRRAAGEFGARLPSRRESLDDRGRAKKRPTSARPVGVNSRAVAVPVPTDPANCTLMPPPAAYPFHHTGTIMLAVLPRRRGVAMSAADSRSRQGATRPRAVQGRAVGQWPRTASSRPASRSRRRSGSTCSRRAATPSTPPSPRTPRWASWSRCRAASAATCSPSSGTRRRKKLYGLNASGRSPYKATREYFKPRRG